MCNFNIVQPFFGDVNNYKIYFYRIIKGLSTMYYVCLITFHQILLYVIVKKKKSQSVLAILLQDNYIII